MRSKTFEDEFAELHSVPGVFYGENELQTRHPSRPEFEAHSRYPFPFAENRLPIQMPADDAESVGSPIFGTNGVVQPIGASISGWLKQGTIEEELAAEIGVDVSTLLSEAKANANHSEWISQAIAEFGTEAFGTYLPWHRYATSTKTPWGIYLFLEPMVQWAADLQQRSQQFNLKLDDSQALRLAFFAAYRHELFHFHVEAFCVRQEILLRRPFYRPYDQNVYQVLAHSDGWLEEALAQAVVLESNAVSNRLGLPKHSYREFLEAEFDRFGPGYRAFRCEPFGTTEAHGDLAAQIITARPDAWEVIYFVPETHSPKSEYRVWGERVPKFVVWNRHYASQFQLQMPNRKKVHAFLNRSGFIRDGGTGDHERWRYGRDPIHVNFKGNELDIASLKAMKLAMGKTIRELLDEIEDRRRRPTPAPKS